MRRDRVDSGLAPPRRPPNGVSVRLRSESELPQDYRTPPRTVRWVTLVVSPVATRTQKIMLVTMMGAASLCFLAAPIALLPFAVWFGFSIRPMFTQRRTISIDASEVRSQEGTWPFARRTVTFDRRDVLFVQREEIVDDGYLYAVNLVVDGSAERITSPTLTHEQAEFVQREIKICLGLVRDA